MNWLFELHKTQPVAHAIGALAFVCVLGMALGSLKFRGIGLGTAGVLFAGIVVGHFGNPVDQHTLDFVKEFGLILFVFTIGLQLGPGFFAALRHQGVKLNLLAATIVILGAVGAPLIGWLAGFDLAAVLGIFSGASTNTPSLGAGTQTLSTLPDIAPTAWHCPLSLTPLPTRWRSSASSERCFCSNKSSASIPCARPRTFAAKNRAPGRATGAPHARGNESESRRRAARRDSRPASKRASPSRAFATAMKRAPRPTRP